MRDRREWKQMIFALVCDSLRAVYPWIDFVAPCALLRTLHRNGGCDGRDASRPIGDHSDVEPQDVNYFFVMTAVVVRRLARSAFRTVSGLASQTSPTCLATAQAEACGCAT